MRTKWIIVALVFGAVAIWVAAPYVSEVSSVDGCLDSGGSFDYANGTCDYQDNHPYVAYGARHSHAGTLFGASFAVATLALVTHVISSRKKKQA